MRVSTPRLMRVGVALSVLALGAGLVFPAWGLANSCAVYGVVLVSWPLWTCGALVGAVVAFAAMRAGALPVRNAALFAVALNLIAFATAWLPYPGSCS